MCGYDVKHDLLGAVFQYKRPKQLRSGTDDLVRFDLNMHQWLVLLLLFDPGEAFFTLPVVMTDEKLPEALSKTVFVDVHGIRWNTSLAYVPLEPCSSPQSPAPIRGKITNGRKYAIDSAYVYCWDELRSALRDHEVGLLLRDNGHETSTLRQFETRIATLDTVASEGLGLPGSIDDLPTEELEPELHELLPELLPTDAAGADDDSVARLLGILRRQHRVYPDSYAQEAAGRAEMVAVLAALVELHADLTDTTDPTTHLVGDSQIGMFA
jgi:hypothetical protein